MAVIEKAYASLTQLRDLIRKNLPPWLQAIDDTFGISTKYTPYRLAANENEWIELGVCSTTASAATFSVRIHSAKNNVDTQLTLPAYTLDTSSSNSTGIVRLIIKDKTFAVSLLSTDYVVRTGAIISFVGDVSDGNFYVVYSSGGITTSNTCGYMFNMHNTNSKISAMVSEYADYTALMPLCDYAHGSSTPIPDVFVSVAASENIPSVLYNGSKKYYRVTPYLIGDRSGVIYRTPPFYVEADK